jgi:hypothetical protein
MLEIFLFLSSPWLINLYLTLLQQAPSGLWFGQNPSNQFVHRAHFHAGVFGLIGEDQRGSAHATVLTSHAGSFGRVASHPAATWLVGGFIVKLALIGKG